jgi:hypothetical protein
MTGRADGEKLILQLSQIEAAIVAAALRQYEPYWSPDDIQAAEKLSELAQDIRNLLDRVREAGSAHSPGLLGTFSRPERTLRPVPTSDVNDPRLPTRPPSA